MLTSDPPAWSPLRPPFPGVLRSGNLGLAGSVSTSSLSPWRPVRKAEEDPEGDVGDSPAASLPSLPLPSWVSFVISVSLRREGHLNPLPVVAQVPGFMLSVSCLPRWSL